MRKWHTAGIDRGLTVLVRVFYQDSQFLHTELKVTETERERKKRREKVRSINITVNLFNTSFYFVMRADKKSGGNDVAYIQWCKMRFFHALLTVTKTESKKKKIQLCKSCWSAWELLCLWWKACIVVQLEWKGLWSTSNHMKVQRGVDLRDLPGY